VGLCAGLVADGVEGGSWGHDGEVRVGGGEVAQEFGQFAGVAGDCHGMMPVMVITGGWVVALTMYVTARPAHLVGNPCDDFTRPCHPIVFPGLTAGRGDSPDLFAARHDEGLFGMWLWSVHGPGRSAGTWRFPLRMRSHHPAHY
jgi:hypothetical protein